MYHNGKCQCWKQVLFGDDTKRFLYSLTLIHVYYLAERDLIRLF